METTSPKYQRGEGGGCAAARYGDRWADWRDVSLFSGEEVREVVLAPGEAISALTGYSYDRYGDTWSLGATTTSGAWGPWGDHTPGYTLRPSPPRPGLTLALLSGSEEYQNYRLVCHWRA